ncbi:MAG TPA: BON domain-containing protein [Gammaproteobacteria bacterium]|nr:BON domain-containing protein [Gammaproteobacteria bacterium]
MPHSQDLPTVLLAAFEKDTDINLHDSPIRVSQGMRLRLEGEVANIVAKRKARRIAIRISGHADIEDCLRLRPGQRRTGKALLDAVVNALSQEPAFRDIGVHPMPMQTVVVAGNSIRVSVEDSVVRLEGMLGSLSHRRLAEVITWWVPGTCDVHNHLRVQPAEQDNDDEISDAILMVLEKDPLLHAENIRARVEDRTVTLTGTVHSQEQLHMAVYDCWYVPGVHAVHAELEIMGA